MSTDVADKDVADESDATSSSPSAVEYADAVAEQIHLIRRLYQARLSRAYSNAGPEIVYMAGRILDFIARHPGCLQSEIAAYFHRDKGQIAKVIANLREQELIGMEAGSHRRSQKLVLTAKGEKTRLRSQQERDRVAQLGIADFNPTERRLLIDLLRRMRRSLESEPL